MIVTMAGIAGGQLMISFGSETGLELFLLASVLVSLAVVPILISVGKAPEFSAPERISLRRIFQISPLAVIGLALNGICFCPERKFQPDQSAAIHTYQERSLQHLPAHVASEVVASLKSDGFG